MLKYSTWIIFFAALGAFATLAASVSYVNIVFNPFVRWGVLFVLVAFLIFSKKFFSGPKKWVGVFLYTFLLVCVLSTVWSDVPVLSGTKSVAYFFAGFAYVAGGVVIASKVNREKILHVFWPLVLLSLIAGLGGVSVANSSVAMSQEVTLYRGLTGNSNFLGILILCSLPPVLLRVILAKSKGFYRFVDLLLVCVLLLMLMQTFSRASILSAGILGDFTLLGVGAKKFAGVLLLVIMAFFLLVTIFPEKTENIYNLYVYKGAKGEASVLASREGTWGESSEGALEGGLIGLGFGVSYGFTNFQAGLSSSSYGREKGNASLALIEEVGVLGFGLFMLMLVTLLIRLTKAAANTNQRESRLLLYILMGSVVALFVNAQFEAWFLSPGGAATPVFWILVGMSSQLARQVKYESRVRVGYDL